VIDAAGEAKPSYVGDPRQRDLAAQAVAGCDAIVHLLPPARSEALALEVLDIATRGTYNLLTTASAASRFILISSLGMFERYPMEWLVTEQWAPRPSTAVHDLVPYLAELTVRELARTMPVKAITLRLGEVVDDEIIREQPVDPRWLHIDDAVQAVERALRFEPADHEPRTGWWVFHVMGGGRRTRFPLGEAGQTPFGYTPHHDLTQGVTLPLPPAQSPVIRQVAAQPAGVARRVVIFGAGGPLGAATAAALARDHVLRVTDLRSLAEIIAENKPQSLGAPLPQLLDPPHERQVVDITDPGAVLEAVRGMDAIINCSVLRWDPVESFRVNMLGAYNVMRAAVACGIRRVVHTGPAHVTHPHPASYWYDFDVGADVPQRPMTLYNLTKFLGQEVCRLFADEYNLEVPSLLFGNFINPENPYPVGPLGAWVMMISWEDAAQAVRQALRVPSLPHPYEQFHITTDLPHGKYSNDKAKQLLNWQPRDRLEAQWRRDLDQENRGK
jgi:nucleoside-diphosphate-sugar epimerase